MSTMLIDNSRDRSTMLVHLAISLVVGLFAILAYMNYAATGVYYARERDNIGNTYCLYWMPFSNFENSVTDQPNGYACPYFAGRAQGTSPQS